MYVFVSFVFRETKFGNYHVKIGLLVLQKKIVLTWIPTQIFEFEFGMQGLNFIIFMKVMKNMRKPVILSSFNEEYEQLSKDSFISFIHFSMQFLILDLT